MPEPVEGVKGVIRHPDLKIQVNFLQRSVTYQLNERENSGVIRCNPWTVWTSRYEKLQAEGWEFQLCHPRR
jgi:hypothetical protein